AAVRLMSGLITRRCKSCQTLYQSRMRTALASLLLVLAIASEAVAKQRRCTFRLHVEANENDGAAFSTHLKSQYTGKNVVIEKVPTISENDVVAFYPYPATDGMFGVLFQLDEHGKLALDTLSIEKRGTSLFVFVNNRPLTELRIDRRVLDGRIFVASGLTASEIELMKKDWRVIGQRKR
ncbi:MAG: hypothetical protein ABI871_02490, partial [Chthoniobacterales bacterium]